MKNLFIITGGTGGHIIPALRFTEYVKTKDEFKPIVFGDKNVKFYLNKFEGNLDYRFINSSKLNKNLKGICYFFIFNIIGFFQSSYYLFKYRPRIIIGFGGYATFPTLVASVMLKLILKHKIIIHEQNSIVGKVNRIFCRHVDKIATAFSDVYYKKNLLLKDTDFSTKLAYVGNPTRANIVALNNLNRELITPIDNELENIDNFNILVIGGSGGAKIFSDVIPDSVNLLEYKLKSKINVYQQCKKDLVDYTKEKYEKYNIKADATSFFDDMSNLIKKSHLIIGRAGASSLFEFMIAKKPMILIPFKLSADNHQYMNAKMLQNFGCAVVIEEGDFKIEKFSEILTDLINDRDRLRMMAINADKSVIKDSCEELFKVISYL